MSLRLNLEIDWATEDDMPRSYVQIQKIWLGGGGEENKVSHPLQ
jgi:hypothetical protein